MRQQGNITIAVWQDNKPVSLLATNVDPTKTASVNRKNKDGSSRTIPCPETPLLYNRYMGGVDLNDQLRGYYQLRMKGRKYYKYIFWFLVDLAITNAYILCKHHTHLQITSTKDFRVDLAKALIGTYHSRKRPGRPSATPAPKRFKLADHFPRKGTESGESGHRCHHCRVHHKRRRESVWYCDTCDKYLCHTGRDGDCFLEHHQLQ